MRDKIEKELECGCVFILEVEQYGNEISEVKDIKLKTACAKHKAEGADKFEVERS